MLIKINKIIISNKFKKTHPSEEKLKHHLKHYIENNKFLKPIIIDKNKNLHDGYCTYLIAKLFNIKEIDVITIRNLISSNNKLNKINNILREESERMTFAMYPHEITKRYFIEKILLQFNK